MQPVWFLSQLDNSLCKLCTMIVINGLLYINQGALRIRTPKVIYEAIDFKKSKALLRKNITSYNAGDSVQKVKDLLLCSVEENSINMWTK